MPANNNIDAAAMVAKLRQAMASNVTEVTIGTQTVTYRSVSELMAALKYYENLLAQENYGGIGRSVQAIAGRRFI